MVFAESTRQTRSRRLVWLALLLSPLAETAAQSQASDTGTSLARAAVQAMGGTRALARLQAYRGTGKVELLSGFPGTFIVTAARPGRRHVAIDIGYIQPERAVDGDVAWERNASVRELAGRELARARRWATFLPGIVSFVEKNFPVRLARSDSTGHLLHLLHSGEPESYLTLDKTTLLPIREQFDLPYEEGVTPVSIEFGEWREVGDVKLPHRIGWTGPDLPYRATIERYQINPAVTAATFANPNATKDDEPIEASVATIPKRLYRESVVTQWQRQWGIPFPPTERWIVDLVVNEKYGRWLDPLSATVDYLSGGTTVKTVTLSEAGLQRLIKFPVTRYAPQPQIYNVRFEAYEATTLEVDRLAIQFVGRAKNGTTTRAQFEIPVERYQRSRPLLFPVRGNFIIPNGHGFEHIAHVYEWSQHFGNDIVCLGPAFELSRAAVAPTKNEDYFAFGGCDIVAPDDGTVIFARNDVPDGRVPAEYLQMKDPIYAIGGNIILIQHGPSEYSLMAHNQLGSVLVKTGDRVTRGQRLAKMGASGSPGLPHLHYQLQASPGLFDGDGLPAVFDNVFATGWTGGGSRVAVPRAGLYYIAR